jgi:hypothetical protein
MQGTTMNEVALLMAWFVQPIRPQGVVPVLRTLQQSRSSHRADTVFLHATSNGQYMHIDCPKQRNVRHNLPHVAG